MNSEARRVRRELHALAKLDSLPRVVGEKEVAVEIDMVAEARDLTGGRDAEARLDRVATPRPSARAA